MIRRPIVLGLVLAVSAMLPAAAAETAHATLRVTTIQCLSDLHDRPELNVLQMNDRRLPHALLHYMPSTAVPFVGTPKHVAPGVDEFVFDLLPGNYEIYASAKGCHGQMMALVLAGHERSVSLALGQSIWTAMFDHDHAGAAGTLTMPGASLELADAMDPSRTRAVPVQDGAVYLDSLQRMRWILRVTAGCCRHADFPLDLSGVRAGDYVTFALSAADVVRRLDYDGSVFSDPEVLAADEGGAWYSNPGRNAIGFVRLDGSHAEATLPGHKPPEFIVADGAGGAWFSRRYDPMVWHVDRQLAVTSVDLSMPKNSYVYALYPQAGPVVVVAGAGNPLSLFRVTPALAVSKIDVPAQVELGQVGAGPDGSLWFNVEDKDHVARLDDNAVHLVSGPPGSFTADVQRISDGFYYVAYKGVNGRAHQLIGASELSSGTDRDNFIAEIVHGNDGSVWIARCSDDTVQLVVPGATTPAQTYTAQACPSGIVPDGRGGAWFVRYETQAIVHIDASGKQTEFRASNPGANPFNLSVDSTGRVWFPEGGVNRIGSISGDRLQEIDLGNPGAMPGFTIVP